MEPRFVVIVYMQKYELSLREMADRCDLNHVTIWKALKNNIFSPLTAQKIEDGSNGEILFEHLTKSARPKIYRQRMQKRQSLLAKK